MFSTAFLFAQSNTFNQPDNHSFFNSSIQSFNSIEQSSIELTEWFPSGLNIQPFTANFLEPKAGFSYLLGKSQIRLDIGTSADIFKRECSNTVLSFGADIFTYTRLRGEKEFHFPVETIDYLFGINSGYKIINKNDEFGFRFRFSHISAHLVDGSFDNSISDWRDHKKPRVYSREFFELFPYYKKNNFRFYLGLTYLLHTSPEGFKKFIYQAGFDYFAPGIFDINLYPFVAYDFKAAGYIKLSGNNIIIAGFKFGNYESKGLSIYYAYYSGKSIHGEYFDLPESYSSIGLNVDL